MVKDLPAVGKNLSDVSQCQSSFQNKSDLNADVQHLNGGAVAYRAKKGLTLMYMRDSIKSIPAMVYWYLTGKGPASSNV